MNYDKIFKDEVLDILEKEYKIKAENIEKNKESTDGNVFVIYGKKNKYIMKIYDSIEHTHAVVKLYYFLERHSIIAPKIVNNKEDSGYIIFKGKFIVVTTFVEGKHIEWDNGKGRFKEDTIKKIAKELRKLHEKTQDCDDLGLPKLTFGKKMSRNSVLHFDLTKHNIFINKYEKIGFIDFDDAKYGASVCDVAIIISMLFFSKTNGANLEDSNRFISDYYGEDYELKKIETPVIKEFCLEWLNYLLHKNQFDTSTQESFEVRRNLINESKLFL